MPTSVLIRATGGVYQNGSPQGVDYWSDGDDATYANITKSITSGGVKAVDDTMHGWLEPFDLSSLPDGTATSVGEIVVHFRYSSSSTSGSNFYVSPQIVFDDPGGGASVPFSDLIAVTLVAGGAFPTLAESAYTVSDDDYARVGLDITQVVERLAGSVSGASGARAIRFVQSLDEIIDEPGTTKNFTVYEAWLELVCPDPVAPSILLAPPCQLYPRNDHQGAGSGAIWPPPSSQQAGRPGGYY